MKFIILLFLVVLSSLPTIGYTSPDLSNKPYFNTIELINRIQKYDDTKFIRYREEKINDYKSSYYFYDDDPDYFVRNERGIIRIGYPFSEREEMVNNPALFNYISDKEKEEAITIIAIGIDDKEKAREIFDKLYQDYLTNYQEKKECLRCTVESTYNYQDMEIGMFGMVINKQDKPNGIFRYDIDYAYVESIYFPPLKSTPEDLKKYYGTF
ncbi:Uncharacterised protein [Moraxella equi]|uniref:Uncharacterized protein n=2 Tax=Moraxella equi TaxID=60442 RepID=A0A378QUU3_9GAMM|nr:hypothetical protein B5J93_10365 [Moraxella equi]STZ04441.1 Uncharacterised protein [Moraxella equi]